MRVWEAALVVLYESGPREGMRSEDILKEIERRKSADWRFWDRLPGDKAITQLVRDLRDRSKPRHYIEQTRPRSGVFRIKEQMWEFAESKVRRIRENNPVLFPIPDEAQTRDMEMRREKARRETAGDTNRSPTAAQEELYHEGELKDRVSKRDTRSPNARKACLDQKGYSCMVCNFTFAERFPSLKSARTFIHVHHVKSFKGEKRQRTTDPIKDLVPLCPNCHAMAHMEEPPISVARLKELYQPE